MTTSPLTLELFFSDQIKELSRQGFQVVAITGPGITPESCRRELEIPVHMAPLRRAISPWRDLVALFTVFRVLRQVQPEILHTHTPKAGLIGMMAGWLARVPTRLYTINGLPLVTQHGWRKQLMQLGEVASSRLATGVISVSESLRAYVVERGLCPAEKVRVLGHGGSHGVDVCRFDPLEFDACRRQALRQQWGVPKNALVIGYAGRITADKGLRELISAWNTIRAELPASYLLLGGLPEENSGLPWKLLEDLHTDTRVRMVTVPYRDMPSFYAVLDIAVLPTYREGLPNAALEAAAMQVPLVATKVMGCVDVVQPESTGMLIPPADADALVVAVQRLARDRRQREQMGRAARSFVENRFSSTQVTVALVHEYEQALRDSEQRRQRWPRLLKRTLDVTGSVLGLVATAPLLGIVALLVRIHMGSPVLFRQERIGWREQPFEIYKFRTMANGWDASGRALPDAQRLTQLGLFLRRYSLDELPQLWNILTGDLSLVGPRPLLPQYLPRYTAQQRRRHSVRPGLTGLAQINGRNALSWEDRFALDVEYVERWSFRLDLQILRQTAGKVLWGEGIGAAGHVTMPEFLGTPEGKKASG